eukprot:425975_1
MDSSQIGKISLNILKDGIDPLDDDENNAYEHKTEVIYSQDNYNWEFTSTQYNHNYNKHKHKSQNNKMFHILSRAEIDSFVKSLWNKEGITKVFTDQLYNKFIQRNKELIWKELFYDTNDFQQSIAKYHKQWINNNMIFDLKIRHKKNSLSTFLITFANNKKHQNITNLTSNTKDNMTFVCKCIFTQFNPSNAIKIINCNKYMMSGEYLNYDKKTESYKTDPKK